MLCLVSMERERFSEGADKVPCLPGNLLDVGAVTPNGKESSMGPVLLKFPHLMQGTIDGHEHLYTLDDKHTFEKNRPVSVCGNTAAMLGEGGMSHLCKHFSVSTTLQM